MSCKVKVLIAALCALLLMPLTTGAAWAQKRVALVIGNSTYQNVARLPNPLKDATAVAEMFKKTGFNWVKTRQDLGNLEFKRALREFMDAASDADVAVVYYAGHGIQVRDMNYMIPVDARLASEIDAEDEAVSLDRIVMALEPAKRLRLVILDACRDNPFGRTMKRRVAMRGLAGGLAQMEPTLGETLIAYAAKAGSTAEDGDGENSPFAAALVKHLAVPGLDIRLAFGQVRDEVLKRTGNRQEPFVYGSLGGETISLVSAPAQPRAQALNTAKGEYELVERIGTKKAWEAFLSSQKEGLYADLARAQLAKLSDPAAAADTGRATTPASVEPVMPPGPSGPSSEERRVWERIRDSGDRTKLIDFIGKYPASPLAETAKNRLDALDWAAQEREEKARLEREAAQRREEEAQRRNTDEAARKLAEREAAKQREEAGLPELAKTNPTQQDEACRRDDEKLARLKMSVGHAWAREELKRLQQQTTCDRMRSELMALLAQPTPEITQKPAVPQLTPANTIKLEKQAQPKVTAPQRDEAARAKREQAKREQTRREDHRQQDRLREASRPKLERARPERAARLAPQPTARSEASYAPSPRHLGGGGMVGIGF